MSFKSAMAAATLMALASIFAQVGCAGDECAKAADRFEECVPLSADTTTSGGPETTATCEGLILCESQCINDTDCTTLKAVFDHKETANSPAYLKCIDKCNTMAR